MILLDYDPARPETPMSLLASANPGAAMFASRHSGQRDQVLPANGFSSFNKILNLEAFFANGPNLEPWNRQLTSQRFLAGGNFGFSGQVLAYRQPIQHRFQGCWPIIGRGVFGGSAVHRRFRRFSPSPSSFAQLPLRK